MLHAVYDLALSNICTVKTPIPCLSAERKISRYWGDTVLEGGQYWGARYSVGQYLGFLQYLNNKKGGNGGTVYRGADIGVFHCISNTCS